MARNVCTSCRMLCQRLRRVLVFACLIPPALCFGSVKSATAGDQVWSGLGPRAKSVQAIAVDPLNPSRMWAATFGAGVYRSLDGGSTWAGYRDSLTNTYVRCLAVNRVHPDSVFCGTNDGVFVSTDGGATWKRNLPTAWSVRSITIHPFRRSIIYASTYGSGIYKSYNGGASWNTVNLGLPSRNVSDAATFGTISSLSSDARIMQVAARFTF